MVRKLNATIFSKVLHKDRCVVADAIRRKMRLGCLTIVLLTCFSPCSQAAISEGQEFSFEVLTKRNGVIWSFDFLPDGRVLFTERSGSLAVYDPKTRKVDSVSGAPKVWSQSQGGLLDVRVHPDFSKNQFVYLTYSEPVSRQATTALGRARLAGNRLEGFKKIFTAIASSRNGIHFGSRVEFDGDGHIYFSVGDRNERQNVQSLQFHTGKVLRLNEDGTVPSDNPFVKNASARKEIWSFGHRNPQGLAIREARDGRIERQLWECEMGPLGGDEVNLVKPGLNYGWPIITYGREYSGEKIGEGEAKSGLEQPIVYYAPSISPSGCGFYFGSVFPKWRGNLFLANLSGQHLRRLVLEGDRVVKQEELLKDLNLRFRTVREGSDGLIYVSTDDGKLARLRPSAQ